MTKIMPLRAVRYNQEKIKNLANTACPPYDVISASRQQYYHDLSPYNFIRILLGKDIPGEDKYQRAAHYFKKWLKDGVFVQDEKPAIYFYSQQYYLKGQKMTRLGFIALLRLGEEDSSVFAHEHTRIEPKEDRLSLIKQVKANLSPIFVLFADRKRIIQRAYREYIQDKEPLINITDDEKTAHKIWRIDLVDIVGKFQAGIQDADVFIADGHHRYEVACMYRELMKERLGAIAGEEDFNYILAYFTDTASRDLTILPIHRLVKLPAGLSRDSFLAALRDYFTAEEIKDKARFYFLLEKAGKTEHVIGMYRDNKYWLLRLKNVKILDREIHDKPPEYRSLDIAVLNYVILKKILGMDLEDKENISFSHNAEELIVAADDGPGRIAFILNPVKIQQIISVALSHNKMPSKSTYFYPKVLSGLVINKHEE